MKSKKTQYLGRRPKFTLKNPEDRLIAFLAIMAFVLFALSILRIQ